MFESLSHWLSSKNADNCLFEHPEDEAIHLALASILYRIMMMDEVESRRERHEFAHILEHEFHLDTKQIEQLHEKVKDLKSSLKEDLSTIHHYLKDKDGARLNFMRMLNHLISLDGVKNKELDIFYAAQKELFPDLNVG